MDIVEWSEGIGMIAIGEVGAETNAIVTVFFGSSEKRGWEKNKEERIRWMSVTRLIVTKLIPGRDGSGTWYRIVLGSAPNSNSVNFGFRHQQFNYAQNHAFSTFVGNLRLYLM
eukprot:scaffold127_cov187-Alexandrium_tamarense.AAC.5